MNKLNESPSGLTLCFDDNGDDTVQVVLYDEFNSVILDGFIAWDELSDISTDIKGILVEKTTIASTN